MVVSNNTLSIAFAGGAKIEAGKADLIGDFAYQAPVRSDAFARRLDSALQARQAEPAPAPRSPQPEAPQSADTPNAESGADNAQQADSPDDASADERKAKTHSKPPSAVSGEAVPAPIPSAQAAAVSAVSVVSVVPAQTANAAPSAASDSAAPTQTSAAAPAAALQAPNNASQIPTAAPIAPPISTPQPPIIAPQTPNALPVANAPIAAQNTASLSGLTDAPAAAQTLAANLAPQIPAPAASGAAPIPSGHSVDSRLAAPATTPGTETASAPALPAAPFTAKTDIPQAVINATVSAQNAAPTKETTPALTSAVPALDINAAKSAPVSQSVPAAAPESSAPAALPAKPTAAATSDHLARLRTVGGAENPAPAPSAQTATASGMNEKPLEIAANALPSAALNRPNASLQNIASAPDAAQTNAAPALTSPFDAITTAPVSALTPTANAALTAASITPQTPPASANHPAVGTNQAVVTAEIVSAGVVVRQAQADAGGESSRDDQPAQNREIGSVSAVKSDAAKAEMLNSANVGSASSAAAANASISNETAAAPIDRTKLLAQVNQHLETMRLSEGRGEAAFHLNPDSLGSLKIAIAAHADGVSARIVAEHAGVRQVLESASEHLRAALENRGLKLHSLEVTATPGNPASRSGAETAAQQQQRESYADGSALGRSNSNINRGKSAPDEILAHSPAALSAVNNKVNFRLDYRA